MVYREQYSEEVHDLVFWWEIVPLGVWRKGYSKNPRVCHYRYKKTLDSLIEGTD